MSRFATLKDSAEYSALLEISERLGSDPLQVQGPGGNTSIKADGAMWVKASGTWLAEALSRDIMVPVDLTRLLPVVAAGDAGAEAGLDFVPDGETTARLRPSIETTVHAVFDWPVVLHTHCVSTLSLAVRRDAEAEVASRLADLRAVFIPYAKPGLTLATAIQARAKADTAVLVLGNHGVVAGGNSVAEAAARLAAIADTLALPVAPRLQPPDSAFAGSLDGTGWMPAPHPLTQALALDPDRLALARAGSLYPDHVIFLGPSVAVAEPGESVEDTAARMAAIGPARKLVLVPGQGAAIPADATPSVVCMARALGDVLARVEGDADLNILSEDEEYALLNWDAEKHRQALEMARAAGT